MTAPRGLGARGRAFFVTCTDRYELEPAEQELLIEICRLLDLCEVLQAEITKTAAKQAKTGPKQVDSGGKLSLLGVVRELRASRVLLRVLLRQLDLPSAAGEAPLSLRSQRARRAAQRRWELQKVRHGTA